MLRDLPPFSPQPDIAVFMNTPGAEDERIDTSTGYVDPFDDVFGSAPSSPVLNTQSTTHTEGANESHTESERVRQSNDPSDIPRLRSIHVTNGYREGIAASKEKHIQEGFDEGYGLGAEIALKAGYLLGALEGMWFALPRDTAAASITEVEKGDGSEADALTPREEVRMLFKDAEAEMKVEKLFSKDYFGEDGIWIYDVPGQEDESEITFAKVAEAHPVVMKWSGQLQALSGKFGLDIGRAKT